MNNDKEPDVNKPIGTGESRKLSWCHRLFIPVPYGEQTVNPITKQPLFEPKGNLIFMKCLAHQCAIWDRTRKQCSDLTANIGMGVLADLKVRQDGEIKILDGGN